MVYIHFLAKKTSPFFVEQSTLFQEKNFLYKLVLKKILYGKKFAVENDQIS